MALTLNNLTGFETGGLEEASSTVGSPSVQSTVVRTGDYALQLPNGAANEYYWPLIGAGTDAGNQRIVSFHVRFSTLTPVAEVVFFAATEPGGTFALRLVLETDGDLRIVPNSGLAGIVSNPFTVNIMHRIDILWDEVASGALVLWLDGAARVSMGGRDWLAAAAVDNYSFRNATDGPANIYFDDCYSLTGATSTAEFLGSGANGQEVFRYQNQLASGTPNSGDALGTGTWDDVGQTPAVETAGNVAIYAASNVGGHVFTDDTASGLNGRHGPHGDANIDGSIEGAMWWWRLLRGAGAGTTHSVRYGNDVDTITEVTQALTTAYVTYNQISEAATIVPLATEHFAQGFKTGGAQDIDCAEMWAMILHVPSGAGPQTISGAGAIASLEAFGTGIVAGAISGAGAIASLQAFGTPRMAVLIRPSGIGGAEAFGTIQQLSRTLPMSGIASLEAFGTLKLTLLLLPTGIGGAEAFGTPSVAARISPSGIASLEAFGSIQQLSRTLPVSGVASAEAFGTLKLTLFLLPAGIAGAEALGSPKLNLGLTAAGIATSEAFGTLKLTLFLLPAGIATGEAFGVAVLTQGGSGQTISGAGAIASLEAFGTIQQLSRTLPMSGLASLEAFGSLRLTLFLLPAGIAGAEAHGSPQLKHGLNLTGIPSAEAFGTQVIQLAVPDYLLRGGRSISG